MDIRDLTKTSRPIQTIFFHKDLFTHAYHDAFYKITLQFFLLFFLTIITSSSFTILTRSQLSHILYPPTIINHFFYISIISYSSHSHLLSSHLLHFQEFESHSNFVFYFSHRCSHLATSSSRWREQCPLLSPRTKRY